MITQTYIPTRSINPIGSALGAAGVIGPYGTPTPATNILDVLGDLSSLLGLVEIGVYTPWAARESSITWQEVRQPPETNVSIAGLTDANLRAVVTATFGTPLGWVAILSDVLPSVEVPEQAFQGTPYEFFHTQAIYSQADPKTVPTIRYLHWGRLRDQGDTWGGNANLEPVAAELHGTLVFAMQVNYDLTRQRAVPSASFEQAHAAQRGVVTIPITDGGPPAFPDPLPDAPLPAPYPEPDAPAPAATGGSFWLPVIGAGVVCSVLGFVVVRAVQAKKRRSG